jgi:cyclic beta-1,2-glucan synthetase
MAFAALGQGEQAGELLALLNPINRTATRAAVHCYKVEPYVVAADVYSVAPHIGRGGWTWYTGSAGWMYRAALESILGVRLQGATLHLAPCLPPSWPRAEVRLRHLSSCYEIAIENPAHVSCGIARLELDGVPLLLGSGSIELIDDGATHQIVVVLGPLKEERGQPPHSEPLSPQA